MVSSRISTPSLRSCERTADFTYPHKGLELKLVLANQVISINIQHIHATALHKMRGKF